MARNIVVSDEVERELVKLSIKTGLGVGDVVAHLLAVRDMNIQNAAPLAQRFDTSELWSAINEIQQQVEGLTDSLNTVTEKLYT